MRNNKLNFSSGDKEKCLFKPIHPEKYIGDVNAIVYRSSWELYTFKFCDTNPNVIHWASEEIAIPYMKPTFDQQQYRPAQYFPDLYVEYVRKDGSVKRELIEIKPKKQTKWSKSRNNKTKMIEDATHIINLCKWNAAGKWCEQHGIEFKLLSENSLFRHGKP